MPPPLDHSFNHLIQSGADSEAENGMMLPGESVPLSFTRYIMWHGLHSLTLARYSFRLGD